MPGEDEMLQQQNQQQNQEISVFQQEQEMQEQNLQIQRNRSIPDNYHPVNMEEQNVDIMRRTQSVNMNAEIREEFLRKNVKERKIDQIIKDANAQGDSELMVKVKEAVLECNNLVYQKLESDRLESQLDEIEKSYMNAIAACQNYCDHRNSSFERGKTRKKAVKDTLELFQKELSVIPRLREMGKSGQIQKLQNENNNSVVDMISMISFDVEKIDEDKKEVPSDPLQVMTYNDFEKYLTAGKKDEIEYRNKTIRVIPGGLSKNSRNMARSAETRLLVNRFVELAAEKIALRYAYNEEQKVSLISYLEGLLGTRRGEVLDSPISVQKLQRVMTYVAQQTSETEKMSEKGKNIPADKHGFALAIKSRLSLKNKNKTENEEKREIRGQLEAILKAAKKNKARIPDLTETDFEKLSAGQYFRVQDRTLHCLSSIQNAINKLNGGKNMPYINLTDDHELINDLLAYNMAVQIAESEESKIAAENALSSYLTEAVFKHCGKRELGQAFKRSRIGSLIFESDTGLRELVIDNLGRKKNWSDNTDRVMKGMKSFQTVCRELTALTDLQKKAINKGLTEDDAELLKNIAKKIDTIVTDDWDDIRLVARELKGTRFYIGYESLKKLKNQENFSFLEDAKKVVDATLIQEQQEQENQQEQNDWVILEEEEQQQDLAGENVYQSAEQAFERLSGNMKKVAGLFILKTNPSDFIKESGDEGAREAANLYTALRDLSLNTIGSRKVMFAGEELKVSVNKNGQLQVQAGEETIRTPYSAKYFFKRIELDASHNVDKYGFDANQIILIDTIRDQEKPKDRQKSGADRRIYLNILRSKLKMEAHEFRNVTSSYLAAYANIALVGKITADDLRKIMEDQAIALANQPMLNEQDTLEVIQAIEQREKEQREREQRADAERVVMPEQKNKEADPEEIKWEPQEEKIKNLIADILFVRESWTQDLQQKSSGVRLRETLYKNIDTLKLIIEDPAIIGRTFDKLKMPGMEGAANEIQNCLTEFTAGIKQLKEFNEWLGDTVLELVLKGEDFEKLPSLSAWEQFKFKGLMTMIDGKLRYEYDQSKKEYDEKKAGGQAADEEEPVYETFLEKMTKMQNKGFEDLDKQLGDKVNELVDTVQDSVTNAVKNVFDDKDGEQAALPEKSLEEIIKDNVKGQEGQGKFFKLILTQYFKRATDRSKRSMLASAFRDVKPSQLTNLKEPKTEEEKEQYKKLKEQKEKEQQGSFLGGFLKGAGPLLHKILQGLPMESLPLELKTAVDDMKSNLAPIADEIVKARMDSMIERSYGAITKIDVVQSLGAASVGQAFLCKIYGPSVGEQGKDVVIKLLRPNVQNQIAEESRFMLEKAKEVDKTGGMLRTYVGQLESIEREMDLRNEAENVKRGEIYNKGSNTVESMKLVNLVEPEANSLMLEKAPGTTVDKYLKEIKAVQEEITQKITEKKIPDGDYEAVEKLYELRKQLAKRQKYVVELSKKWVTEGIYDSGFYHGDLHAGNIMIDDEKATVIDFGNATQVTKEQQECIMHMVCAAESKSVKGFRDNFKKLLIMAAAEKQKQAELENSRQGEKYIKPEYRDVKDGLNNNSVNLLENENVRQDFEDMLDIVFHKEGDTGSKIAVALLEAQKMGLELPAAVYNFSQCQIRLQNTIQEMNNEIEALDNNIEKVMHGTGLSDGTDMGNLKVKILKNIDDRTKYEADKKHNKEPEKIDVLLEKIFSAGGDFNQEEFLKNYTSTDVKWGMIGHLHAIPAMLPEFKSIVYGMDEYIGQKEMLESFIPVLKQLPVYARLQPLIELLPESVKGSLQEIRDKMDVCFQELDVNGLKECVEGIERIWSKPELGEELNAYLELEKQVKEEQSRNNSRGKGTYSQNQKRLAEMAKKYYPSLNRDIRKILVSGNDEELTDFMKSLGKFFKQGELTTGKLKNSQMQDSIKEEFDKIKALRDNNMLTEESPELTVFMKKLQNCVQISAEYMKEALSERKSDKPKSFYDAMGDVIKKRTTQTIFKLGLGGIWNYSIKNNDTMSAHAQQKIREYENSKVEKKKQKEKEERQKNNIKCIKEQISTCMNEIYADVQALNQKQSDEELVQAYKAINDMFGKRVPDALFGLSYYSDKQQNSIGNNLGALMTASVYNAEDMHAFFESLTNLVRETGESFEQLGWNENWEKLETWQLSEDTMRRLNAALQRNNGAQ